MLAKVVSVVSGSGAVEAQEPLLDFSFRLKLGNTSIGTVLVIQNETSGRWARNIHTSIQKRRKGFFIY